MAYTLRLLEFMRSYGMLLFSWTTMISMLGIPHFSILASIAQVIVLLLYTYFGHRFAHTISQYTPINYINPHIFVHHNNIYNLPRWLNLLQEAFMNAFAFLIILVIQYLCGIHIFSTSIVVCAALLYVFIHIADYSFRGNKEHTLHHQFHTCNFAPNFMDVLFETRCEPPDTPYSDGTNEIIHGIVAVVITFICKITFGWT